MSPMPSDAAAEGFNDRPEFDEETGAACDSGGEAADEAEMDRPES